MRLIMRRAVESRFAGTRGKPLSVIADSAILYSYYPSRAWHQLGGPMEYNANTQFEGRHVVFTHHVEVELAHCLKYPRQVTINAAPRQQQQTLFMLRSC